MLLAAADLDVTHFVPSFILFLHLLDLVLELLLGLFDLEILLNLISVVQVSVEHSSSLSGDDPIVLVDENRLHDLLIEDVEVLQAALGRLLILLFFFLLLLSTIHDVRVSVLVFL